MLRVIAGFWARFSVFFNSLDLGKSHSIYCIKCPLFSCGNISLIIFSRNRTKPVFYVKLQVFFDFKGESRGAPGRNYPSQNQNKELHQIELSIESIRIDNTVFLAFFRKMKKRDFCGKNLFSLEYVAFVTHKRAHTKAYKKLIVTVILVSHLTCNLLRKKNFLLENDNFEILVFHKIGYFLSGNESSDRKSVVTIVFISSKNLCPESFIGVAQVFQNHP